MNPELKQKIEKRAYEIYQERLKKGIPGSALGDWLCAEAEILKDRRMNDGCPRCGRKLLALQDKYVVCLNPNCSWKIEAKRIEDFKLPKAVEVKKLWE